MVVERKRGWGKQLDCGILLIYGKARVTNTRACLIFRQELAKGLPKSLPKSLRKSLRKTCTQEPIREPQWEPRDKSLYARGRMAGCARACIRAYAGGLYHVRGYARSAIIHARAYLLMSLAARRGYYEGFIQKSLSTCIELWEGCSWCMCRLRDFGLLGFNTIVAMKYRIR